MNILWLSWKDQKHPLAGGAEVVTQALTTRLVQDGHNVTILTAGFKGAKPKETLDGRRIIRLGNRFTVYWQAYRYYKKHLVDWPDIVIDETNTIPFFAKFYVKEPNVMFVHMLCRKIWFYELPLPFSFIGYLFEPLYLRLLSKSQVITVSNSTKQDLLRNGFRSNQVSIISEGIEIKPVANLTRLKKYDQPTVLSLGSVRAMKRTIHQIEAFELAKQRIPNLQLKLAGDISGKYGQKVLGKIESSKYRADIEVFGRVSKQQKVELMQRSHILLVTSVKEGWCLVVTEAASQGTPAVVYNIDGLRDSVRDGETGYICTENTSSIMSDKIVELLGDTSSYKTFQKNAWVWSKQINFNTTYDDIKLILNKDSK